MNRKRLYRCRYDRQLAGVAGGMAEYFDVDPTVVRILWIASVFFGGFTILLYIVMAIIVPLEPVGYGFVPGQAGPASPAGHGGEPVTAGAPASGEMAAEGVAAQTMGAADPHASQWAMHAAGAAATIPHRHDRRPGGGWFLTTFGVLLVVFGGIALLGPMVPGWVGGIHLGPAFVLALGVALLAASLRRTAEDRQPEA